MLNMRSATFLRLMTCGELKLLVVASRPAGKPLRLLNTFLKDLIKVLLFNLRTLELLKNNNAPPEELCVN